MKTQPSLMPILAVSFALMLVFTGFAEAQNLGTTMLDQFTARTSGWWSILQNAALQLFRITATLEVCLFGIRMVMQRSQTQELVSQFVMALLFMAFIYVVINNYEEWAKQIALNGLKSLASNMSGNSFDPGAPIELIMKLVKVMNNVVKDASMWDFGMILLYVVCMAVIIVVFALICCLYILAVCEFHIAANIAILIVGLAGSTIFKDYAINVFKYIFGLALKLFVLTLILNIGFDLLNLSDPSGGLEGQSIQNISVVALVEIILQAVILLALAKTLPGTVANILSGTFTEGGNPLAGAAGAAAGAAIGFVAGTFKAGGAANNARKAWRAAGMTGAKGIGRAREAIRQLDAAGPNSVRKQLNSQIETLKASKELDKK
jgi:P-type conjugative transfer protein TrbL